MIMEKLICTPAEFIEIIEDTVKKGGSMPLVVTGNSMNPFMKDGRDTVWLEACKESDYRRGKILLFRREDGKIVLHRVKKVLHDGILVMHGDAQYWCEEIKEEQVLAVVTFIERNGKKTSCNSLTYKIKIELWQLFKPVRLLLCRVQRKIKKVFGKSE